MSTLSEAGKLLKGSDRESKFNVKAVLMLLVGVVVLWFAGNAVLGRDGGLGASLAVERAMPTATLGPVLPTQAVYALPTEEPTATAWPTPIIIEREIASVVTVEVPGPVVYVEVPGPTVEVTRIVEVPAVVMPTVTPVPLAPGTLKVCASVEGATGLYIGGEGVVSGGCKTYSFGVGQTTVLVHVNR